MYARDIHIYQFLLGYGRSMTDDIAPDQFCNQPLPNMNHPAWILGHLTFVSQFGVLLCGGEGWLDKAWANRFGIGSTPTANASDYPSSVEIFAAYEDGHARLTNAVESVDPHLLEAPTEFEMLKKLLPTKGLVLTHILTSHEATHLGQLSAWRRAMGLKGVLF